MENNAVIDPILLLGRVTKVKNGSAVVQKYRPDEADCIYAGKMYARYRLGNYIIVRDRGNDVLWYDILEETETTFIIRKLIEEESNATTGSQVYLYVKARETLGH